MWITTPFINTTHGFSTRVEGVSPTPFNSLNLGGHEDSPENIRKNRDIALRHLGLKSGDLSLLKQVHGTQVVMAQRGVKEGDAQVTSEKGVVMVVNVADCMPVLLYDPVNQVAGAAHCGWRGTVNRLAAKTIGAMKAEGADPASVVAVIGPGICKDHFEVGGEVIQAFKDASFPREVIGINNIDLAGANRYAMIEAGVLPANIHYTGHCSFEKEFFSFRRDQGKTGRMWGLIVL